MRPGMSTATVSYEPPMTTRHPRWYMSWVTHGHTFLIEYKLPVSKVRRTGIGGDAGDVDVIDLLDARLVPPTTPF